MAKLSAHGFEVARVVLAFEDSHDYNLEGNMTCRYEWHISFRSDGHIMRREVGLDVHPSESDPRYRRHDFGWKLWKKITRADVAAIRRYAVRMARNAEASDKFTVKASTV